LSVPHTCKPKQTNYKCTCFYWISQLYHWFLVYLLSLLFVKKITFTSLFRWIDFWSFKNVTTNPKEFSTGLQNSMYPLQGSTHIIHNHLNDLNIITGYSTIPIKSVDCMCKCKNGFPTKFILCLSILQIIYL